MQTTDCAHHWLLDSPDGRPAVSGHCKKCGLVKRNYFKSGIDFSVRQGGDNLHYIYTSPKKEGRPSW